MKALFINPGKTAYGSGQSMLGLLENRDFCAEVICPPGGALEESLLKMGVKHHPVEFGKYAFLRRPDWQFSFYRNIRRILKESKPDVLVINLDGNTPLVTLAAVRAGIPIIRFSRFEFQAPSRWLDKCGWLKASAVICPSELVKRQVLAWAPPELQPRVHCWYDPHVDCPVSNEEAQGLKEELGLGISKVIVFVGRLHPLKRIETAIRALAEIRAIFSDTRLLIVGSHDGSGPGAEYEQSLRDLAGQLGVLDSVVFLGYRDRQYVPVVMAASDVCVLPSESESFGMVLTEAWSVQVPTVASDVGGCREITVASGGGLLSPVGDHQDMAARIVELFQHPALAKQYGAAGEAWVRKNCDSKIYTQRFHRLLDDLTNTGGERGSVRAASPIVSITGGGPATSPESKAAAKVCVATFYHDSHPGAVLQAYALSKTLGTLGHPVEMLAYQRPVRDGNSNTLKQQILRIVTHASRRDSAFRDFRSTFLKETPATYPNYEAIVAQPPQAGSYICGSDQIWNPALLNSHQYDPAYFVQFGADAVSRISYAASFGGHQPDAAQSEVMRKYLNRFDHISVREPTGQAFLKRLLGREVALTLDPTLLLDNYNELLPNSPGIGDHVLLYALQQSPEIQAVAKQVSAYFNKPLWSCGGPVLPWKQVGIRKTEEGPLKWLERINEASVVVTNSYHGMIFSLLLRKRVVVVPLQGGLHAANERLFHLCDVLGVRKQVVIEDLSSSLGQEINWDVFDSRLAEQREASLAFLRTALTTTL